MSKRRSKSVPKGRFKTYIWLNVTIVSAQDVHRAGSTSKSTKLRSSCYKKIRTTPTGKKALATIWRCRPSRSKATLNSRASKPCTRSDHPNRTSTIGNSNTSETCLKRQAKTLLRSQVTCWIPKLTLSPRGPLHPSESSKRSFELLLK